MSRVLLPPQYSNSTSDLYSNPQHSNVYTPSVNDQSITQNVMRNISSDHTSDSRNPPESSVVLHSSSETLKSPLSISPLPLYDKRIRSNFRPKDRSKKELKESLNGLIELKKFLLAAPLQFVDGDIIHQFRLPTDEQISCVRWNQVFCITGTDIVRCLVHRFTVFGREVVNRKKFEEGIFSDLRNLKINVDAMLENPKSELLEFLYKRNCVRTKKKQKVFFWYSVYHEQLFIDALERELKKEAAFEAAQRISPNRFRDNKMDLGLSAASTVAIREPALSFKYDSSLSLAEQIPNILDDLPDSLAALVDETTTANVPEPTSFNSYGDSVSSSTNDYSSGSAPHTNSDSCFSTPPPPSLPSAEFPKGKKVRDVYPITPAQTEKPTGTTRINSWQYANSPHLQIQDTPLSLYHSPMPTLRRPSNISTCYPPPMDALPSRRLYMQEENEDQPQQSQQDRYQHQKYLESEPVVWCGDDESMLSKSRIEKVEPQIDTDFPLEVLSKEDPLLVTESQFEMKFTDYAHHNRPAVSLENCNQSVTSCNSEALLGSPFDYSPMNSLIMPDRGFTAVSSAIPPQSPCWDQLLAPDAVDFYREGSKNDNFPLMMHPMSPPLQPHSYNNRFFKNQQHPGRVMKSTNGIPKSRNP